MGGRVSHLVNAANGYHEDIYVKIVTVCDGSKFTASSIEESGSNRIGFTRIRPGGHLPFLVPHQNNNKIYFVTIETEAKHVVCDSYAMAMNKSVIVDKLGHVKFARSGAIWEDDYGQYHKLPDNQDAA